MEENEKLTQAEKVALKLRKMITLQEIPAGERLIQEEISKELGVSKIPVREALKILEAEGLVYSKPYKGAFVTDISIEYVQEIYFLRSILEGISCSQATTRFDCESLHELYHINKLTEKAFEEHDTIMFIQHAKEFHDYIHSLSGYKRLGLIIQNLNIRALSLNITNLKEQGELSLIEHHFIYERIQDQDAEGAGNAIRMHLQRAGMDAVRELKKVKSAQSAQ